MQDARAMKVAENASQRRRVRRPRGPQREHKGPTDHKAAYASCGLHVRPMNGSTMRDTPAMFCSAISQKPQPESSSSLAATARPPPEGGEGVRGARVGGCAGRGCWYAGAPPPPGYPPHRRTQECPSCCRRPHLRTAQCQRSQRARGPQDRGRRARSGHRWGSGRPGAGTRW